MNSRTKVFDCIESETLDHVASTHAANALERVPDYRKFSRFWVMISVLIFVALEALLSMGVQHFLGPSRMSAMFTFRLDMLMHLAAYFSGAFIIGFVSPGIRIDEPCIGALISALLTLAYGMFMPNHFWGVTPGKALFVTLFVVGVAYAGSRFGEKSSGELVE